MSNRYPVLTYPGDVTGADEAKPGEILGWDEMFRPYEVIDVEFCPAGQRQGCPAHGRVRAHTTVYLQHAQPETMREKGEAAMLHYRLRGLL